MEVKNKEKEAIDRIWEEFVKLDYFFHNNFAEFMNSQIHIKLEEWNFVNNPYSIIKEEKFNLPQELYEFCDKSIFQQTIFDNFNGIFDIMRNLIAARKENKTSLEKIILKDANDKSKEMIEAYSKKVFEFREIAYRVKQKSQIDIKESSIKLDDKKNVKALISEGKTDLAFRELLKSTKENDELQNSLILLSSRISRTEMDYRMGLIELEKKNVEVSKIVQSLLHIVDELKNKTGGNKVQNVHSR